MGPRVNVRLAAATVATVVSALLASTAHAADQVYWANNTAGISFANLDGSGAGGDLNTTGATVSNPNGVAIDPASGEIYWANTSNISFANLDGSSGGDLSTNGATVSGPEGVAVDPALGKIYWANNTATTNANAISWANLDGSGGGELNTAGATVNHPEGVAIDAAAGRIYWANVNATSNANAISYANLDGTGGADLNTTGASTPGGPEGVAIDPVAGRIYWANEGTDKISFASLSGGGGGDLNTGSATVSSPAGVAIDPTAGKIYWGNPSGSISFANLDDSGDGGDLNTNGATVSEPIYPVLLTAPSAASAPGVAGGSTIGSHLSCSEGEWASDLLGSFLFRAPRSFAYQWTVNGADIAGATSSSYTASAAGSYTCTVTAANQAGPTSQTSAAHSVSAAAPPALTLMGVSQSHRRWREGNALPHIASAKRPPVGTTFRFTLNVSASVRLVFVQQLSHHRTRRRGSLSVAAAAGAHRVRFQGRLSKHKRLKPGRYRVMIVATNAAGQQTTAKLRFTIVKPRK